MTATDELRGGLRELGVQYQACGDSFTMWKHDGKTATYAEYQEGGKLKAFVSPAQAIAATVGRGTCGKVYLVEVSDDLLDGWYPMTVYLHRESAEDCAEALRKEEDGIWQFARVSELKVVDE